MKDSAQLFFDRYVAKKRLELSGNDWQMVISALRESADNCFRCKRQGCSVCKMTKGIADKLENQL